MVPPNSKRHGYGDGPVLGKLYYGDNLGWLRNRRSAKDHAARQHRP
jgi:hypothetical protein